ncbi:hypothetical protein ACAX43_12560 [Paraburkholderia sp. IW21]|uniref:hypothetical protein n=1 Tax=Paraburkholderia sp. IW21 TaxID=3242488 RepID=UPI00351FDFED
MNFYAGATFNYAGTLQLKGPNPGGAYGVNGDQPDYSQWTVTANLFDPTGDTLIGSLAVTNNSTPTLPSTNGNFQLTATAAQTALWPVGKAQLVLKVSTDIGTVLYADPIWFRIKPIPMGPRIS